ncbi:MAG: transporter substrate-binding domain-containing protein, partial [Oscillospiraceae bacterium]|nr:transporter substrate-binding domain-containing protein [Oscillospiraceae bacterium]
MQNISKNKKVFPAGYSVRRKTAARMMLRMKRISAFAVSMVFVLCNFITVFADDVQSNNRTVKAGIFSFEGYHMKDEDDRLTGYGIEFLNLVSEYSRLNFQYTGYDRGWGEMLDMLENGEIDVVTSARRTSDREERFAFSLPIGRNDTILSIRVNNTQIHRGDYKTYNGMTVGLVAGSSQNQSLAEFAEENGFSYNAKEYSDSDVLASALQSGEVDAILSSDLRKAENEKTLDVIEEADFYAIVRKDDTELLNEINYAIEQMDINEGDWKNELFYKYYGPVYSSALSFTEREMEYIDQVVSGEKTITMTAFGDRAPYSFTENGELKGILPDYFAGVMELAGLPYEIVVPEDKDAYYALADTNGVNVIIDELGSDEIVEDAVYRGFNTEGYMTARMARVTRQDFHSDIRTVAVSDIQGKDLIERELLEGYTVLDCSTGEEAVRAVLNREADAAYVYAYTAQLFVNHDATNSLHYSMLDGMNTRFSMYVSDNTDHELITILNKCIKQTSDETLNQLVSKYTSYTIGDMSIMQYMQANPGMMLAAVLVFALTVCVILTLYLRGQWSRKLLHATEQSNIRLGEQLAIVEALSRDYTNVYAINEECATARIIKLEGFVADGLKKGSTEEHNYAPILEHYISSRVHPDDQQELSHDLSLDNIKEKLNTDDEYMGSYRIVDNGDIHHFQYTYLKIEDNGHGQVGFILAGFRNIDEVIRKEQEQKDVLAEALAQAQYANNAKTTFLNNMS